MNTTHMSLGPNECKKIFINGKKTILLYYLALQSCIRTVSSLFLRQIPKQVYLLKHVNKLLNTQLNSLKKKNMYENT